MLLENHITFTYREYKKDPLSLEELQRMLGFLGEPAHSLLRKREKAYKELGLKGTEDDETLLSLFVQYPTLMQRPVLVHEGRAVLGRPVERLLEIIS